MSLIVARVMKAKNVRRDDTLLVSVRGVSGERVQRWRTVSDDPFSDGYGTSRITLSFGEGYDNQDTLDPDERVVVIR